MNRRVYLWFLMVLFAVGVVLVRWQQERARNRPREMEATLPDGGRLVVWKVSQGTNHSLMFGRWPKLDPWRRQHRWLTNFVGPETEQILEHSQRDLMSLFYIGITSKGGIDRDPIWARACVDEHGCVLGSMHSRGSSVLRGTNVCRQDLPVYPRREERVDIRFGGYQRTTNDVRIQVRNVSPWRGSPWEPQPLPATATHSELQVAFEGWGGSSRWPQPRFRVEAPGIPSADWKPYTTWFEDVTGNRSPGPDLCRRESAWRVTGRFGRTTESALGPGNSWTVFAGEFPGDGQPVDLGGKSNRLEGVSARVVAIGGKGKSRFESLGGWHLVSVTNLSAGEEGNSISSSNDGTQDWVEATSSKPWAVVSLLGLTSNHHWQLVLVDEAGRHTACNNWSSAAGSLFVCNLESFPATGRGELRLVIQRLIDCSFVVAPPRELTVPL